MLLAALLLGSLTEERSISHIGKVRAVQVWVMDVVYNCTSHCHAGPGEQHHEAQTIIKHCIQTLLCLHRDIRGCFASLDTVGLTPKRADLGYTHPPSRLLRGFSFCLCREAKNSDWNSCCCIPQYPSMAKVYMASGPTKGQPRYHLAFPSCSYRSAHPQYLTSWVFHLARKMYNQSAASHQTKTLQGF
jgi:hypothetical protein